MERDVVVAAVIGDMLAGRAAVYADLVAYDEVAHHSGPHSRDATRVLERLDRSIALLAKVAEHAPRSYRLVLLSDHGQSPGETFRGAYGLTLRDLVRAGCGLPVPRRAGHTRSGAEARYAAWDAVRTALHRPVEDELTEGGGDRRPARDSDPIVLASGNLGLISFPDVPERMSREQIDRRHPSLLRTLANHPGIGFLLVRGEAGGSVVLGPGGAEVPVAELDDDSGPLATMGPGAADAVRRTDTFPHVADIMVNSVHDPATGGVHAFEEQIGSHGGLGGEQSNAFLLSPLTLPAPVPGGGPLAGAEQVHAVLKRWLYDGLGPQIPLGTTPVTGTETRRERRRTPAEPRPGRRSVRPTSAPLRPTSAPLRGPPLRPPRHRSARFPQVGQSWTKGAGRVCPWCAAVTLGHPESRSTARPAAAPAAPREDEE